MHSFSSGEHIFPAMTLKQKRNGIEKRYIFVTVVFPDAISHELVIVFVGFVSNFVEFVLGFVSNFVEF